MLALISHELDYPDGSGHKLRLVFNGRERRIEIQQHKGDMPVYVDVSDMGWFAEIIEEYATLAEEIEDGSKAGKPSP